MFKRNILFVALALVLHLRFRPKPRRSSTPWPETPRQMELIADYDSYRVCFIAPGR